MRGLIARLFGLSAGAPPSAPPTLEEIAASDDFALKQRWLAQLLAEFGWPGEKVWLSPKRESCDFLAERFVPEGEALPQGTIEVYYDPAMTYARMGCCLAHEIQHLKFFALRDAYLIEPPDGPLHGRFAEFTPQLLASRGGVSKYSCDHWSAWRGAALPELFADEMAIGGSEPINETIADVAKAFYNWGREVNIDPVWRKLCLAIDDEYARLTRGV